MNIPISETDIERIIDRRTIAKHALDSPRWTELIASQRKRYAKKRVKQALLGSLTSRYKRSQEKVRDFYEDSWDAHSAVDQARRTSANFFEWRGVGYEAHYSTSPALHNYLVSRSLAAIQPTTALELGCGNGLQLFVLASRHPQIRFHGAELTAAGVQEAETLQEQPELPEELADFALDPVLDDQAHRRIDFRKASAADLPFEDSSIDVIYTTIALEQMEEIRDSALASVARVAREYVVMVEPFRDFNLEGTRRDYVISRDIFAAHVKDLPSYGLEPVYVYTDFPCKVALGVGLVIAKVG